MRVYGLAIIALSGLALLFIVGIVLGEALGAPGAPGGWFFGGAMVGALLLTYSAIVLLLRRMGVIGPRKAER